MTRPPARKPVRATLAPALPAKVAQARADNAKANGKTMAKAKTKTNTTVAAVRGKPAPAVPTSSVAPMPAASAVPAARNRPAARPGVRPGGTKAKAAASSPEAPSPSPAPSPVPQTGMALHTADERGAFLREADLADCQVKTLCMTLAYAGCQLSEVLALTLDRVDLAAGVLVIESLKKRRAGIYRAVPVPPALLEALDLVHGVRERQASRGKGRGELLWPWSRMTGWRVVHAVMQAAKLDGPRASPKGLRHGFGAVAVAAGIPLNVVQKWLGHAQLSTTAIYADAVGAEEHDIAQRMGV